MITVRCTPGSNIAIEACGGLHRIRQQMMGLQRPRTTKRPQQGVAIYTPACMQASASFCFVLILLLDLQRFAFHVLRYHACCQSMHASSTCKYLATQHKVRCTALASLLCLPRASSSAGSCIALPLLLLLQSATYELKHKSFCVDAGDPSNRSV